jgi:hypothetical protein
LNKITQQASFGLKSVQVLSIKRQVELYKANNKNSSSLRLLLSYSPHSGILTLPTLTLARVDPSVYTANFALSQAHVVAGDPLRLEPRMYKLYAFPSEKLPVGLFLVMIAFFFCISFFAQSRYIDIGTTVAVSLALFIAIVMGNHYWGLRRKNSVWPWERGYAWWRDADPSASDRTPFEFVKAWVYWSRLNTSRGMEPERFVQLIATDNPGIAAFLDEIGREQALEAMLAGAQEADAEATEETPAAQNEMDLLPPPPAAA